MAFKNHISSFEGDEGPKFPKAAALKSRYLKFQLSNFRSERFPAKIISKSYSNLLCNEAASGLKKNNISASEGDEGRKFPKAAALKSRYLRFQLSYFRSVWFPEKIITKSYSNLLSIEAASGF